MAEGGRCLKCGHGAARPRNAPDVAAFAANVYAWMRSVGAAPFRRFLGYIELDS
jgi:hypothetical protein